MCRLIVLLTGVLTMLLLGISHSHADPSAVLMRDGKVAAFMEEERLLREKHAFGRFPSQAVRWVLQAGGIGIKEIDAVVQGWDCDAYERGEMLTQYQRINEQYPPDESDLAYQRRHLERLSATSQRDLIHLHLRRDFGETRLPPVAYVRHHLAHACMAYFHSGMDEALVLTVDGSGEWVTTAWWLGREGRLRLMAEVHIPHSLGWFYSAFTEYLGFKAYDGEYKVMGLAAYGKPDRRLRGRIEELIWYDGQGGFSSDPLLLVRGPRKFSHYFSDQLVEHIGHPPRSHSEEITPWHMSLAYEVQLRLENIVSDMVAHWTRETGVRRLALAGGVALNIKMNGRLFMSGMIDDIFVHPLCADSGVPIGAGLAYEYGERGSCSSQRLTHVSWGPEYSDDEVERILIDCKVSFTRENSVEDRVADLLAQGKIVGWFQGRMEAGPRALGNRSILADPRSTDSRERINAAVKFREFWRPFCPSMTEEGANRFLSAWRDAPFMIIGFPVTTAAKWEIPAVVHVDDSSRPQIVGPDANQRYRRLLELFNRRTGVPCLLNTSFNIRGEPIVCSPHDALRTFYATGLDALALGSFLLVKEGT